VVKTWPKWAQRHVVLGLDLQGGSHILLEVDSNSVKKDKLDQVRDDVRRTLRDAKIGYTGLAVRGDCRRGPRQGHRSRRTRWPNCGTVAAARRLLGSSGAAQRRSQRRRRRPDPLTVPQAAITERIRQSVEQSIQIVERRVNELGTVEPLIQRQGVDRILVQVPGLQDPTRLKELLGKTAKLDFRMVDSTISPDQAQQGRLPPDSELLMSASVAEGALRHQEAGAGVGRRSDRRAARFRPAHRRADRLLPFQYVRRAQVRQATLENVGQPFAIVLDNEVISAPVIREPITGGSGQISGSFTVQQRQRPRDPAARGRAAGAADHHRGAHRRSGPWTGLDRGRRTRLLCRLGAGHRLHAADLPAVRIVRQHRGRHQRRMIFGILSLLNATLTLPGIAGIVLTVGIAVDSNVLIYERIREELRGGRTAISAIDAGFTRALATILDSNITTFIAAAVLFYIGTGPVRGFAVTLGIGIVTTVFTAFTVTRLIVAMWVAWKRPKTVPI
jgi:preprotein translocase subunit SecD